MRDFSIAVLAGGQSRRMGQNKSFVLLDGKPMLAHVLAQLSQLNAPIFLVANTPDEYAAFNLPIVQDVYPHHGALGGLYTAIKSASTQTVLCAACDMPFIQPPLLNSMLDCAAETDDAVLAFIEDRWQIFPGVYRQSCCASLEAALRQRRLRIQQVVAELGVRALTPEIMRAWDADLRSFWNLNTPDELARANSAAISEPPSFYR